MIVLREPIVRLLFERGAFDARATEMTAFALTYLAAMLALRSEEIGELRALLRGPRRRAAGPGPRRRAAARG